MKDLNFDELDEAVTSLMKGVDKKDTTTQSKTLDIGTTLAPDEAPAYSKLNTVAEKIGSETIDKQETTVSLNSTPTPQRNGRFMDVMHRSSDMKAAAPRISRTVSRVGANISEPNTLAVEQVSSIDTTAGKLPSASDPSPDTDENEIISPTTPPEPQSSPFLPDAKVEKRPLGQAADDAQLQKPQQPTVEPPKLEDLDSEEEPIKKDDVSTVDARDTDTPVSSLDEVTFHVPEEFQDGLLAVERNIADPVAEETNTNTGTSNAATSSAIGTASIPKQYQEKPNTGDASNGSIYDTTDYHQPLQHPEKKKSGWIWVMVIIIVLILGAAAGAAVYYSGIL